VSFIVAVIEPATDGKVHGPGVADGRLPVRGDLLSSNVVLHE
jgi:hypothetical protein